MLGYKMLCNEVCRTEWQINMAESLAYLFFFITLVFLALLPIGAISPRLLNRLSKKNNTRKRWVGILLVCFFCSFFAFAMFSNASYIGEERPASTQRATPEENAPEKPVEDNEASNDEQAKEVPVQKYKKTDTWVAQGVRSYHHYIYTGGSEKPSKEEVQSIMAELSEQDCEYPRCDYLLWSSQAAYESRGDIDGKLAPEVARDHKDTLAGYMNNAFLFFYYGVTGDGINEHSQTLYDIDNKKFIEV